MVNLTSFWKTEACGQTVLPDRSVLIGQKWVENAKIKMRHFGWFSNTVPVCIIACSKFKSFFGQKSNGVKKCVEIVNGKWCCFRLNIPTWLSLIGSKGAREAFHNIPFGQPIIFAEEILRSWVEFSGLRDFLSTIPTIR